MIYFLEEDCNDVGYYSRAKIVAELRGVAEDRRDVWTLSSKYGAAIFCDAASGGAIKIGYTAGGQPGAEKRRRYWQRRSGTSLRFARPGIEDSGKAIRLVTPLWFYNHPLDVDVGSIEHERALHWVFARAHVAGEWFLPTVLGFIGDDGELSPPASAATERCGICHDAAKGAGLCCGSSTCLILCADCRLNQHRHTSIGPVISRDMKMRLRDFVGGAI